MIEFIGVQIKCGDNHSHLALSGGTLHARRLHVWGGTRPEDRNVQQLSETGRWTATAKVWLTDPQFAARAALNDYRRELRALRGEHGNVTEKLSDGTVSESFEEATFEGFQELAFAGHEVPGPIRDETLAFQTATTWVTQGTMTWTLMRDDRGEG